VAVWGGGEQRAVVAVTLGSAPLVLMRAVRERQKEGEAERLVIRTGVGVAWQGRSKQGAHGTAAAQHGADGEAGRSQGLPCGSGRIRVAI
jgi:precorrin isomerase